MTIDELNKSTLAVSTLRSRPQSAPPGFLPTEKQTEGARAVELFGQMRAAVLKKSADASGDTAQEGNQATQMRLQFAIVEKGERLFEGTITLAASRQEQSYRATTGDTSRVYLVTYSFGRPSTLEIDGPNYRAGFAIGVHRSSDWESCVVGNDSATLLLKCTPLP